jgi:hypothetical protein
LKPSCSANCSFAIDRNGFAQAVATLLNDGTILRWLMQKAFGSILLLQCILHSFTLVNEKFIFLNSYK